MWANVTLHSVCVAMSPLAIPPWEQKVRKWLLALQALVAGRHRTHAAHARTHMQHKALPSVGYSPPDKLRMCVHVSVSLCVCVRA